MKRLVRILEIGGLILWQTWLASLMNTSGTDGILDGFQIFLMGMQQTKQTFYMTNLSFDFFGTILVMPIYDCDWDDSKFKRRWRPIKHLTPKINIKAIRFPLFYLEMFLFTYKIQTRCDKPFMISSLRNQFLKLHPYSKHASRGWKWILSQST